MKIGEILTEFGEFGDWIPAILGNEIGRKHGIDPYNMYLLSRTLGNQDYNDRAARAVATGDLEQMARKKPTRKPIQRQMPKKQNFDIDNREPYDTREPHVDNREPYDTREKPPRKRRRR